MNTRQVMPPDHLPVCHLVRFSGSGKCDCGDDERYEREWDRANKKEPVKKSQALEDN